MSSIVGYDSVTYCRNEKVSEQNWRENVQLVSRAAVRVNKVFRKPSHAQPHVVVFIDELNTAPFAVLAMIKECFVDRKSSTV